MSEFATPPAVRIPMDPVHPALRNIKKLARRVAPFQRAVWRLRRRNRVATKPSKYERPCRTLVEFTFAIAVVSLGWHWWNHAVWHTNGANLTFWILVAIAVVTRIVLLRVAPRRGHFRRKRRILPKGWPLSGRGRRKKATGPISGHR